MAARRPGQRSPATDPDTSFEPARGAGRARLDTIVRSGSGCRRAKNFRKGRGTTSKRAPLIRGAAASERPSRCERAIHAAKVISCHQKAPDTTEGLWNDQNCSMCFQMVLSRRQRSSITLPSEVPKAQRRKTKRILSGSEKPHHATKRPKYAVKAKGSLYAGKRPPNAASKGVPHFVGR